MRVIDELRAMHEAGFTDPEIGQHALETRIQMAEAGFRQDEIDTEFGHPPYDPAPLQEHFNTILTEGVPSETGEPGTMRPVTDIWDAFKAGFGMSASGLLAYKPEAALAPDAGMASRVAANIGSIAGDAPFYVGGYLMGGGNPVTGTAAGMALSNTVRKVMMDKYEKGEVTGFRDFWERESGAFLEAFKGYITGAATGKVGQLIGKAPIVSQTAKTALTATGELTTMVAVGNALEGKVPEPQDFLDAAVTLGFLKVSSKVAGKLRQIYAKHGIHPKDVVQDAMQDATIRQDLASEHVVIPNAYKSAEADAILKAKRPAQPTPKATGEYVVQPAPQPTITELAKRMQATVEKTSETGAFYPPSQPSVARVTPPYEAKPAPMPTAKDLVTGKAALDAAREAETTVLEKSRIFRSAEEILQERNRIRSAEEMILQEQRPQLREKRYFPPKPRQTAEETIVDQDGRTQTTGEWLAKELEKQGIVFGEKGEAKWEQSIPVGDAQAAILSRIKYEEPATQGLSLRAIYTGLFDNLNPIRGALKDIGQDKLPANENAYILERLTRGTYGRAKQWLLHGVTDFDTLQPVTRGHSEITKPVIKDLDGLRAYEVAKRALEKSEQGIQTGFDPAQARTVVREGKAKYEAIHQELVKWRDAKIDYMVKAGLIAEQDAVTFKRANKDYVSFSKFYEGEAPTGTTRGLKNPVKRMEGGDYDIQDPIISDVKNAFLFAGLAERNAARQKFVQYPQLAEKVRTGRETITKAEIKKIVDEHGVTEEAAQSISALGPNAFRASANEIVVFEKGKRAVYKVDPAVAEAFNDLDLISTNFLTEMLLHTPANLLRAGVIVTPDYIARNVLRDAVGAFVYAGSNPIKTMKGAISLIRKDDAYQKWLAGGGANATMVALDRDYIQSHIMDLNLETNAFQKAWNVARTPLDVMRAASEFVENATRLGSVRNELRQAKDRAAILALAMISRESTVDFARHGKNLQEFGKMTAFFNPTVQGIDRFVRALKENPVATTSKAMASITLPALYLWWANRDDEEIQNQPDWMKHTMFMTRIPLPDGGSFILRIPMAHELGILFGTLPVQLLEQYFKDNPDAFKNFDKSMMQAFLPSVVPTTLSPMIEQTGNVGPLSSGPLIPASQEKLLPEYQQTPYTTELAKQIGSIIGSVPGMQDASLDSHPMTGGISRALTSPILLENYTRAWTGPMGLYMLQLLDKGLREAKVLPDLPKPAWTIADVPFVRAFVARYPSMSVQSIHDFYTETDKSFIRWNTVQTLAKDMNPKAMELQERFQADMIKLQGIREAMNTQAEFIRKVYKNPEFTPDEKRQLIDTATYGIIMQSQAGNMMLKAIKEALQ